jgi:hypothetical protein
MDWCHGWTNLYNLQNSSLPSITWMAITSKQQNNRNGVPSGSSELCSCRTRHLCSIGKVFRRKWLPSQG